MKHLKGVFQAVKGLHPSFLGFGVLLGAFESCIINDAPFVTTFGLEAYREFLIGCFLGISLLCIGYLLLRHSQRIAPKLSHFESRSSYVVCAAGLVAVCGIIATTALRLQGMAFDVWNIGPLGILFGASIAILFVQWGRAYARLGFHELVATISCAFLLSVLVYSLASIFPKGWASAIYIVALLAASVVTQEWQLHIASTEQPHNISSRARGYSHRLLSRSLWQSLMLSAIIFWVFGLIWDPSLTTHTGQSAYPLYLSVIVGQVIACLIYALFIGNSDEGPSSSIICTIILPISAAILLTLPSIAGDIFVPASFILNALSYTCFSIMLLIMWTSLACSARKSIQASSAIFSLGLIACALAAGAGMILIPYLGALGETISLILFVAYLVFSAISSNWKKRQHRKNNTDENSEHENLEEYLEECGETLAQEYGLTKREIEVLFYLSRGHSQVFIANELVISSNTVHTHVQNIYTKLGVSSKEELISLADQWI